MIQPINGRIILAIFMTLVSFRFVKSSFLNWFSEPQLSSSALELVNNLRGSESSRSCFYTAIETVHDSCFDLQEDFRKSLADRLTICHLEKNNRYCSCTFEQSSAPGGCTWNSDADFQIFTLFFLSIDSICESYASELFRKRNYEAVDSLQNSITTASGSFASLRSSFDDMHGSQTQFIRSFEQFEKMTRQDLEHVRQSAHEIRQGQNTVLDQQAQLHSDIIESRAVVGQLSQDFADSLHQHQHQISHLLEQVQTIDFVVSRITSTFSLHLLGQIIASMVFVVFAYRIVLCALPPKSKPSSSGRISLTASQATLLERLLEEYRT